MPVSGSAAYEDKLHCPVWGEWGVIQQTGAQGVRIVRAENETLPVTNTSSMLMFAYLLSYVSPWADGINRARTLVTRYHAIISRGGGEQVT